MADETPPEREVKEFFFKQMLKVQICPSPQTQVPDRVNLTAVSNKYGFVFVGYAQGFKVLRTEDLHSVGHRQVSANKVVEQFDYWADVGCVSTPTHLGVSSDDTTLSVCITKAGFVFSQMYDIRAFSVKGQRPAPFLEVKLSSAPGVTLSDLAWNPGSDYGSIFAASMSDGSLGLYEVKDTLKVMASLPGSVKVSCLCWSPKGKQLLVGHEDGTLSQLDQQLKEKKKIPSPSVLSGPVKVVDVLWQSTYVYVGAYITADGDQPKVVVTNFPKNGGPSSVFYDDICYGNGDGRQHRYYFHQLSEWEMFVCASANAVDIPVVGKNTQDKSKWEVWSLDDAGRAEIPMTEESYEVTYPAGWAVDLTAQTDIQISETETHGPSPILVVLSTGGTLIMYHMINKFPDVPRLTKAVVKPNPAEQRQAKAGAPAQAPAPVAVPDAGAAKPQTTGFSAAAAGGGFQGFKTPASTATSMFQPVASTAAPAALSQKHTITTTQTPGKTKQASPSPAPSAAPATPAGPSFAFVKPSSPAGGFGAGAALGQPAAKDSSGFSFAASNPAAQPAAQKSIFGAAPSFAAAQKQPETSKAAFSFTLGGVGKSGPGSFSFSATSGPNPLAASTPIATPKKDETPQVQPTKVTQKPASSPQQPQGLHKMPVSQPAPKAVLQAQTKTPSPPRYPQGSQVTLQGQPKPTTVTVQPSASLQSAVTRKSASLTSRASGVESSGEDPFMLAILEEVASFEKELRESKARASQCEINIGTREELYDLKRDTEDLSTFSNDMKETMQSIQSDIYQLRTDNLEALALQEECQMRLTSQNEPKLQSLLRARSLDPQSARVMKEIRSHYQYVQSGIREADQKLDIEWEQYMSKKNKNRRMQVPMMENVYKTIHNNHNVIIEQKRSLDKLMSQVKQMRLYDSPSYSRDVTSLSASESFMNSTMAGGDAASILEYPSPEKTANLSRSLLLKPSLSPGGATGRPLSPEKQAKLCSVLKNHPVTHIKPSKPDLSASKILSGDLLRTRDESDSSLRDSPDPKTGNLPSPTRNILAGVRHQTLAAVSQQGRLNQVTTTTAAVIPPLSSNQIKAPSVVMTTAVQPSSAPAPKPSGFQVSLSNLPGFTAHTKPSVAMPTSTSTVQSSQPGASAGFKVSIGALQTSTPALTSESSKGSSAQSTTTSSIFGQAQSTITPKPAANSSQKSSLFGDGGGLSFNISSSAATSTPAFSFGKKQEAAGLTFGGMSSTKEPAPQAKDKNDTPVKPASDASDAKLAAKPVSARVALFTGKDDTAATAATTSSDPPAVTASAKATSPALLGLLTAKTTAGFSFTTASSASSFSFGGTKADASVFTTTKKEATFSVKQDEQKVPAAPSESTPKEPESKPSQKPAESSEKTSAPSSGGFQLSGGTSNLPAFSFKASSASTTSTSSSIFQTSSSSAPATGSLFGNLGLSTAESKPSSQGAAGFSFASSSLAGQSGFSFGSPSAGAAKQGDASAVDPGTISAANYSFSALLAAKDDSTTEEDQAEAKAAAEQAGGVGVFGAASTSKSQDSAVTTSATTTTSMVGKSTLFGNTATTTASSTMFGKSTLFDTSKTSATTTQGSLFGGAPAVSGPGASSATSTASAVTSSSTFGSTAPQFSGTPASTSGAAPASSAASKTTQASAGITAGVPLFGSNASTTASTSKSGTALFGQAATSGGSIFGNTSSTTPSSGPSLFGNTSTTASSSSQSIFGNTATTTPASGQPLFGKTTTSGEQSIFGNTSATTATSGQSIFGNTGATATTSGQSIFGNTSTTTPSSGQSLFGNTNTTTPTSGQSIFGNSTSKTVFGQTPASGGSLFGGTAVTTTTASTGFGQAPPSSGSGAVFGQPTFGQPSFGGGSTGVFGQSAPASTAESSSSGGAFGSSGGLFSGLGGKPSAEKANKNVFGGTSFGSGAQQNSGSIFGGQSNTATFGSVTTSSGSFGGSGAFTGGGGGSVAAAGFGGFGSAPQSPQQGGFGQAPAFGSAGFGTTSPSFGGTPVFGSGGQSNVFGASVSFSSPVGGAAPQGGIFGSGASSDGGGFGSLAASSGGGGGGLFGGMGQQSNSPSFGSLAGGGSSGGFGSGGNAFGGSAPQGSSFTSYR